jgi:hypothetical protein
MWIKLTIIYYRLLKTKLFELNSNSLNYLVTYEANKGHMILSNEQKKKLVKGIPFLGNFRNLSLDALFMQVSSGRYHFTVINTIVSSFVQQEQRPWVTLSYAQSLDGSISGEVGNRKPIRFKLQENLFL